MLAVSALLLSAAAVTPPTAVVPRGTPPLLSPHQGDQAAEASNSRVCRDRIERVRHERRLPKLVRERASNEPLLIAAVDKRIDGCSVLVMRNNLNDIRPLPQSDDAPAFRPVK